MKFLNSYSLIRGDISVPMRSFVLVIIFVSTQTYVSKSAPLEPTTKSIEVIAPTMGKTETDQRMYIPVSQNHNYDSSKTHRAQNQNETHSSSSKLNYAHDEKQKQTLLKQVTSSDTSTPSTTPSNDVLSADVSKYIYANIRKNKTSRTTHSLSSIISKANSSSYEKLGTQKLEYPTKASGLSTQAASTVEQKPKLEEKLIQKTTTEGNNKILDRKIDQKTLINTEAYVKENKTKNSIFEKSTLILKTNRSSYDQFGNQKLEYPSTIPGLKAINTKTFARENNTKSSIIDSMSKLKIFSDSGNKEKYWNPNSTIHYEEARDEQKKHPSINVKLKNIEKEDYKPIKMIYEQPHNTASDDTKIAMNKNKFDSQAISLIKTTNATIKNKNRNKENSIYPKNLRQLQDKATLKPIQNGFLGPIHMEEKIFSAIRRGKENVHHHSHIRDEKFVEIIAPKVQTAETASSGTESEPIVATFNIQQEEDNSPFLSTTVFQVLDSHTSTTHLPSSTQFQPTSYGKQNEETTPQLFENNQQTESKISDIQIEVYDSTIDSIISSTNFKENESLLSPSMQTAISATKPPALSSDQNKFTQYVVDHTDSSTEKSNLVGSPFAAGVPEPAAIEIHINVSEGHGNESEDLEFSYRQPENSDRIDKKGLDVDASFVNRMSSDILLKANNTGPSSSEQSDEILVVEIIDSGDNSTDNSASFENINVNPIITFCSDTVKHVISKNNYHKSEERNLNAHTTDDLFLADERDNSRIKSPPPLTSAAPSSWNQKIIPDRDSDTIFYISNTEVKVGESLPTPNTSTEQQLKKSRLESQFFPVNYMSSTHPNIKLIEQHRYEEDILLSPMHNSANFVKIIRSQGEISPPLDVTYVGESVMEVEQSGAGTMPTSSSSSSFLLRSQRPDVIIQPAILPEISIGVPIIGELPPQIELKEIDYMPSEEGNDSHDNDVERIVESSIQYGGDLIDEGGVIGSGGFDGIEGSYPFGNPAFIKTHSKTAADFSDTSLNNHMSNFRKDDLIADISGSAEISLENGTIKDMLRRNESDLDEMHSENYTTFYHPSSIEESVSCLSDLKTLFFAWFFTLLPLLVIVCAVFAIGYLYRRHRADGKNTEDIFNDEWPSQTDHLPTLTFNDVIVEPNSKSRNNSQDKQIIVPKSNPASNECYTLGNYAAHSENNCNSKASPNQSSSVHSSYIGPNGSVTTMTLKNNHLIVETEERNDISRDTRETKMHYSNAEKDGIFVVEVARGIDSKSMQDSPVSRTNPNILTLEPVQNRSTVDLGDNVNNLSKNHEEVQIHQPPQENSNYIVTDELQMVLHQIEEVDEHIHSPNSIVRQEDTSDYKYGRTSNTGLSQSDLSSTSSTDSNKRYSYGNQELYTAEKPVFCPLLPTIQSPLQAVERDTDDDHQSENGRSTIQSPTKLESISNGHNRTQSSEKSSNSTNQLNATSSMEYGQGTPRAEKPFKHIDRHLNGSADETRPVVIANGNTITENYFENLESHCNGYDSIMSLPDPPSIEEIKQLNECDFIESNQLDSLPPPPPPTQLTPESNGHDNLQQNKMQHQDFHVESSKIQHENGLKHVVALDTSTQLSNKNSISPAPLTPPASPPHYSNGGNGIPTPIALAVNVNSS